MNKNGDAGDELVRGYEAGRAACRYHTAVSQWFDAFLSYPGKPCKFAAPPTVLENKIEAMHHQTSRGLRYLKDCLEYYPGAPEAADLEVMVDIEKTERALALLHLEEHRDVAGKITTTKEQAADNYAAVLKYLRNINRD